MKASEQVLVDGCDVGLASTASPFNRPPPPPAAAAAAAESVA